MRAISLVACACANFSCKQRNGGCKVRQILPSPKVLFLSSFFYKYRFTSVLVEFLLWFLLPPTWKTQNIYSKFERQNTNSDSFISQSCPDCQKFVATFCNHLWREINTISHPWKRGENASECFYSANTRFHPVVTKVRRKVLNIECLTKLKRVVEDVR